MNYLLPLGIVATFIGGSVSAMELSNSVSFERNINTEINKFSTSSGISFESGFDIAAGVSLVDTKADQGSFDFGEVELDLGYTITDSISLFIKNDFDKDFKHDDTVVGISFSF